jgi:hypothetical protein
MVMGCFSSRYELELYVLFTLAPALKGELYLLVGVRSHRLA